MSDAPDDWRDSRDAAIQAYFQLPREYQWLDASSSDPWAINGLFLSVTTVGTTLEDSIPVEVREAPCVSAALDRMHAHLRRAESDIYEALYQACVQRRIAAHDDEIAREEVG